MNILLISTTVFPLPPSGYAGLEYLTFQWAKSFQKAGHQVSVVAPDGSQLPEGIELIPVRLREPEEAAYGRYKDRLLGSEFDAVMDSTWWWFSVLAQMEADHQLPVIHLWHSDPVGLGSPPPIRYPCLVGLSKDHAELISHRWQVMVRHVYNGIDLDFYKPDSDTRRGERYLFLGRHMNEKGVLEAIHLAKKCKVPLDLYGDVEIVSSQDYVQRVMHECDGKQIVFHPGVPREETVKLYSSHKAIINWPNWNEPFSLVTPEAMACGCPVIARRRGALPELVKHGKTGFVVDTLEEAEEIIKSDAASKIRSEDCVKQAAKFSIENSAAGYLKLFEELRQGLYW